MKKLNAFHVNWTRPKQYVGLPVELEEDYEILTTILSALNWKKYNGSIKLYTDTPGYNYYEGKDLLDLWDDINTNILDNMPETIKASKLWSAGKVYAIGNEPLGSVNIDKDIIVWGNISEFIKDDLTILHREKHNKFYSIKEDLSPPLNYKFKDFNWNTEPINVGICCFLNKEFKEKHVSHAKEYISGERTWVGNRKVMMNDLLYFEQWYPALLAAKQGYKINEIYDKKMSHETIYTKLDPQLITHICLFKNQINNNRNIKNWFIKRMLKRIADESLKYFNILLKNFDYFNTYIDKEFYNNINKFNFDQNYLNGITINTSLL